MKAVSFRVKLTTAFTDPQLIKGGWKIEEKDKLYTRVKGKFKYSYIIKIFGKIRISEMKGELYTEEELSLHDKPEFNFGDGWSNLWNKSFNPQSVEIITKDNIFDRLIENGWKPAVLGVIENVDEGNNLSYYYPAPEGEGLYKLVDDEPGDALKFIDKLIKMNID
ncbi:hypothetical protein JK636_06640 [Clostridium sp. YIM B02515]|uniref:Uncharacterized protein n=1 Tax=Clostridium rhizosphaerae TaxID=2803861 RepID=A0ABS1TAS9_9CLOT|nr:hypothetical protein [Clostridium rhizosphaerae]MBL4935434.1 hypothetical protein [Clostridium rhizosphaerae]